jgi:hypothetical protein
MQPRLGVLSVKARTTLISSRLIGCLPYRLCFEKSTHSVGLEDANLSTFVMMWFGVVFSSTGVQGRGRQAEKIEKMERQRCPDGQVFGSNFVEPA